jgi:hypothetical protein
MMARRLVGKGSGGLMLIRLTMALGFQYSRPPRSRRAAASKLQCYAGYGELTSPVAPPERW